MDPNGRFLGLSFLLDGYRAAPEPETDMLKRSGFTECVEAGGNGAIHIYLKRIKCIFLQEDIQFAAVGAPPPLL